MTTTSIKENIGIVGIVNSLQEIQDSTLPILIIGYNKAKKKFPKLSILDKKIDKNIFWTFGKKEKREEYEKDIKSFFQLVINQAITNISYYYVNCYTIKYSKVKKIINIIHNKEKKYIYIKNNIIYIYYNNYVLGISLEMLDWMDIKRKKIFQLLYQNPNNIIRFSDAFLEIPIKNLLQNKKYVIPYFMSIYNLTNEK